MADSVFLYPGLGSFSGGGFSPSGVVLLTTGSATVPSLAFQLDPDTGLWSNGANGINVSTGGNRTFAFIGSDFYMLGATPSIYMGASSDVALTRLAANSLALVNGSNSQILTLGASGTTSRVALNGEAGANSAVTLVKTVTAIADAVATAVLTVTIPNANHAAALRLLFLSSNGGADAYESSRSAQGLVVFARTTGVNAVATAAAIADGVIATVAAGATHTLAYAVSAVAGAVGAVNTFTITVTIDDSGNLGANQCVVCAELVNAAASGITVA